MLAPIFTSGTRPEPITSFRRKSDLPARNPQRFGIQAELSDTQLLKQHLAGCPDSFGHLMERHRNVCLGVAIRILRCPSLAEDEVQTAFLKAYSACASFQGRSAFRSWLVQIVANQCRTHLRMARRQKTEASEETVSLAPSSCKTPEESFADAEAANVARREIERLPLPMRLVFRTVMVEGKSPRECGIHLGLSEPAVKSQLTRARKELRERMRKHCGAMGCYTLLR